MRRILPLVFVLALTTPQLGARQCLTTTFASNGGTAAGGAMYFDLTLSAAVVLHRLEANLLAASGTPVGFELHMRAGTSVGFEGSSTGWSLAARDDGLALAMGRDVPSEVQLDRPLLLPAGRTGIALVAIGSGHARTNGNGTNQLVSDGLMTLELGSSSNAPFAGAVFSPRVWNGSLCYRPVIGSEYCSPAELNSTGGFASVVATGDGQLTLNDVQLTALGLPPGALVLPLCSLGTASVPMAGGSAGTLCLGGGSGIGRINSALSAASSAGNLTATLNLTALPQPSGLQAVVAGEAWSFQAWYRDTPAAGGSNFSTATTVQF